MSKTVTVQERSKELEQQYGGVRPAARAIGVPASTLSDMIRGEPYTLDMRASHIARLGLKCGPKYERA